MPDVTPTRQRPPEDEQARYYLRMIARIFLPYASARGREYLEKVLGK